MEHDTRDAERRYRDNIIPLVRNAEQCVDDVKSVIYNDYEEVPDQVCNSTIAACDRALKDLDIGCHSSSRAVESFKSLSHGLTSNEQYEFSEALDNLKYAERKLQELCERMRYNVEHRSSFNELGRLIDDINEATEMLRYRIGAMGVFRNQIEEMETLCNRIEAIPAEERIAIERERITELTAELDKINTDLHNLIGEKKLDVERERERKWEWKREWEWEWELVQQKLEAQKAQIEEMLLKYPGYQMMICNMKDLVQYYKDNVAPSVRDAERCVDTVYSLIRNARELDEECETKFAKDYKKVPDEICDSIMAACDRALENLDISRHSISSRAVESFKSLSHGLTSNEQYEFSKALDNLKYAERKLQELCRKMKYNVRQRSSFNELRWLIDNINEAIKTLRYRIGAMGAFRNRGTVIAHQSMSLRTKIFGAQ
ncbi:hypothetical protein WR25_09361 [Diploscapter pachys]|uniref:Uncharacterized protein n=1 Tax=Diploscapter pachys TaxID=2018661 RepID=A0A2A2JKS4_9BILA|nr:hypothetical protein WR25_09361 [Diploscapter pachys]